MPPVSAFGQPLPARGVLICCRRILRNTHLAPDSASKGIREAGRAFAGRHDLLGNAYRWILFPQAEADPRLCNVVNYIGAMTIASRGDRRGLGVLLILSQSS